MVDKLTKRLQKDAKKILKKGSPFIVGYQDEKCNRVFYCLVVGQNGTTIANGHYIFKIDHNKDYPFKAPKISCLTESGRFKVNQSICFTFSDYHQETWSPAWDTHQICIGIASAMVSTNKSEFGTGHHYPDTLEFRKIPSYAKNSKFYNKTHYEAIYDKLLILLEEKQKMLLKK